MSVSIFCSLRPPCRKYAHVAAFGHFHFTGKKKKVDIMKQLMHLVLTGRTGFFFPTPGIKRHSFSSHRLCKVFFSFFIVESKSLVKVATSQPCSQLFTCLPKSRSFLVCLFIFFLA
ncbi:hypothetical protein J3E69DRAFT_341803 [Trichoderma sp. SZMC 28015]